MVYAERLENKRNTRIPSTTRNHRFIETIVIFFIKKESSALSLKSTKHGEKI